MAQKRKTPPVCALAGEGCLDRRLRDGSLATSDCDTSTFSKRGQRKTPVVVRGEQGLEFRTVSCAAAPWVIHNAAQPLRSIVTHGVFHWNLAFEVACNIKTPAERVGPAGVELGDAYKTRGGSAIGTPSNAPAPETITRNAWLPGRIYRVDANLLVEVARG